MNQASLLEVFQLAFGPSLSLTMGAFRAGQKFRVQLLDIPFQEDNRILIEFLGDFNLLGKKNNSDIALVAGLGGYQHGTSSIGLRSFYNNIKRDGGFLLQSKTWPFTVESDLIYRNQAIETSHKRPVRFHLVNRENRILLQSEFFISATGEVLEHNSDIDFDNDSDNIQKTQSFLFVKEMCEHESIGIIDYLISHERNTYSIEKDQLLSRIRQVWKIMDSSIENGLSKSGELFNTFQNRLASCEVLSREHLLAGIYAQAVCEENLDNQLIIASPFCETAGIIPAVVKCIQQKYRIPNEKLFDSLLVAGFVGTLLKRKNMPFVISTAMAAAAGSYMINSDINGLHNTINIAISLADQNTTFTTKTLINLNIKHANLALQSIDLGLCGYMTSEVALD